MNVRGFERPITRGPGGRILTHTRVWSPDGQWLVYDTRSDPAGDVFDGLTIEMVHVETGEVRELFRARNGAHCGVATFHPFADRVVFLEGPEHPTPDWSYGPAHRQGRIVELNQPGRALPLDARDLVPPFTPGALRGGTHLHVWDGQGEWISFTYEDHPCSRFPNPTPEQDVNQRNVGVSVPVPDGVRVPRTHPRNHDGTHFSVLVTRTTGLPRPGSDDIVRACEEGWVGVRGYVRPDGSRQRRALAFQGTVLTAGGRRVSEVFIVDLPEDVTRPGTGPLAGTERRLPSPPEGTVQRRLTFTTERRYPGLQGPRHWLESSPDGCQIAFLMKDDAGVVQLWTVSPWGGPPRQVTHNPWPIASALSWHPTGSWVAHVMDGSVCVTNVATGRTCRLTERRDGPAAPRPEACVFSPDGRRIAFVRPERISDRWYNQICVVEWEVA